MCDYSLHNVKSRPAKVGDRLTTRHFHSGTTGFAAPEDANMAVCLLPGTELSFRTKVSCQPPWFSIVNTRTIDHTAAIFRQVNKDKPRTDGEIMLLARLLEGQEATVLQLPAQAIRATKVKAQEPLTLLR
jgi:hypothetical protein